MHRPGLSCGGYGLVCPATSIFLESHHPLHLLLWFACTLPVCPTVPQSGVVMGGTAILSAVNGLTPHVAGAIDIMVVQQPDGSLKCSPFYGTRAVAAAWG